MTTTTTKADRFKAEYPALIRTVSGPTRFGDFEVYDDNDQLMSIHDTHAEAYRVACKHNDEAAYRLRAKIAAESV
jgi:hypothetical protein